VRVSVHGAVRCGRHHTPGLRLGVSGGWDEVQSSHTSEALPGRRAPARPPILHGDHAPCEPLPVNRLIVARHAESEYNVKGLIDTDPRSSRSPLTSVGIEQAHTLAKRLSDDGIDFCVTSGTLRAVQTGEVIANSLSIPLVRTPLLDDPPAGLFDGEPVEAFVEWMRDRTPDTPVPGTSATLRDSACRYCEAARYLLDRPERRVLVVAHAPALRWIVQAALGRTDALNYSSPLFAHADPVEVDV
jgi:broad specificity phosphatase PhoE